MQHNKNEHGGHASSIVDARYKSSAIAYPEQTDTTIQHNRIQRPFAIRYYFASQTQRQRTACPQHHRPHAPSRQTIHCLLGRKLNIRCISRCNEKIDFETKGIDANRTRRHHRRLCISYVYAYSVPCLSVQDGLLHQRQGSFLCQTFTRKAMQQWHAQHPIPHIINCYSVQGLMKNHCFRRYSFLTDIALPARLRLEVHHFSSICFMSQTQTKLYRGFYTCNKTLQHRSRRLFVLLLSPATHKRSSNTWLL